MGLAGLASLDGLAGLDGFLLDYPANGLAGYLVNRLAGYLVNEFDQGISEALETMKAL